MSAGTADHHQGSAIPGTSGERNNDEETMMNMDCNMFSLPLAFSQALVDIIAHQQTPVNSEIVQKELTEWSNSFQNEMCEANCSGQQDSNCSLMNSSGTTSIIDIESSTRPTHQKAEKRKKPKCERKEVVSMLETSPTHQLEIKNDMFGQCNKILAEFLTNPEMARFFASQLQNVISADTDSLSTDLISNVFTQNVPSVSNEISQGDQSMANELSHHPSGNANALLDLIHLLFNNNNSNNNNNVITDFSGYFNHSKIPESMVNDGAFLNNSNRDGLTAWLISQMTQMYMMEGVNCLPPTHDNERQTPPFDDSGIGEMGDEDELDKSSPTCQVVAVPKSQTNNRSKHKRSNSSLKQSTNSKGGNQTNFECTEMQLPSQKAPRKYKKRKPKTRGEDTNAEVLQSFKQEHGSSTSFVNTLTTEDNQFQAAISSYLTQFASFMASCIPPEMLQSIDSQFFAEIVGNLLSSTIAANFPAWIQFQQRDSQEVFQLPQQQSTQFPELLESFIRAAAATGSAEIASSSLAENFLCQAPTTSLEQPISEGKPIFNQSPANAPVFTLAPQSRSTTNTFSDPLNISLNTLESSSETASTGFCIPPSPFLLMATNTKHLNGSSDHQPSVPNVPLLQFGLGTEKDMEMMMGQQQERRMPAALPRKTTIKQDIENGDPLLLTQETDNNQLNLSHDDGRNNDFDSKQRKNRPRAATAKALVASASANGTFCSPTVPVANNMKGICVANVLHSAANGNILASDAPLEELAELEEFANLFKKQRIKHGFTQGDVGVALGKRYGTDFSQTTISRFEALNLSYKNMCKLRPLLKEWLEETSELIADGATVSDILDGSSVSERAARNEEPSADQTYAYKNGADERPVGTVTPTPPMPFKRRRKRTNLDNGQKLQLNAYFRLDSRPDNQTLTKIANILDLDNDVVRVWFCNRRQKVRKTD